MVFTRLKRKLMLLSGKRTRECRSGSISVGRCELLSDLSTVLQALNQLLEKKHKWLWTKECEKSFLANDNI